MNNPSLVFNADGKLIEENAVVEQQAGAYGSCSTMLNGEAIIFGGDGSSFGGDESNINRQVHFEIK